MINYGQNPAYLNSFINYLINIENKSLNSVEMYYYDIVGMLEWIKKRFRNNNIKVLKHIELNDIYDYLTYLCNEKGLQAITRARICSSIRIFFKYLYDNNLIKENPTLNLKKPKVEKKEAVYLNLNECKILLKSLESNVRNKNRNYAIVVLFLNCGIRLGELTRIDISDIDFITNKIRINGKGNKERMIYLNDICINSIKQYIQNRNEGALFLSERKNRISRREVQYIIKSAIQKAGLNKKYTVHKLRHTCATLLYQYGNVDIRLLQKILGHENINTTEIYTHVKDYQMQIALDNNPLNRRKKNERLPKRNRMAKKKIYRNKRKHR